MLQLIHYRVVSESKSRELEKPQPHGTGFRPSWFVGTAVLAESIASGNIAEAWKSLGLKTFLTRNLTLDVRIYFGSFYPCILRCKLVA